MQAFLNERSLNGQFFDALEFENAVRRINLVLFELYNAQLDTLDTYYTRAGYGCVGFLGQQLCQSLAAIRDRSVARQFRILVLDRLMARDWLENQAHQPEDSFHWEGEVVTFSSIAELAERLLCNHCPNGLLLNIVESRFTSLLAVQIVKNGNCSVEIPCVEDVESLVRLLDLFFPNRFRAYENRFGEKLKDQQTVLRNSERFRRTNRISKIGTRIYQENGTGRYWYVDNFHTGKGAHLEVFDGNGDHVGEATPDGILNSAARDPRKRLDA